MKKTKIICTLGPATDEETTLLQMLHAGMDIVRLNLSHGTWEEHRRRMKMVRRAGEKMGIPVGILLDTKGPEIRTGKMHNGSVFLKEGKLIRVAVEEMLGTEDGFSINYPLLPHEVKKEDVLLIDDGLLRLQVEEIHEGVLMCRVIHGGELKSNKGVNVPGVKVKLPPITEKDREDIRCGLQEGIDFIAASFVRDKTAIEQIRSICQEEKREVFIIAKIENEEGIANIDEIIDQADGIMIARGDLGVEIPAQEVPYLQKKIIEKCNDKMKPVITATQMLDSMMRNPRPTRAEAADVANAIYDGTDAVMLSGESAAGRYPVEAVRMMANIAEETERHLEGYALLRQRETRARVTIASTIAHMSVQAAKELKASCIIAATMSGTTARYLSKFRPSCVIVGVTPHGWVRRRMQLYWGVYPVQIREISTTDELILSAVEKTGGIDFVSRGDVCIMTAGIAAGKDHPYTTNMIRAFRMGEA